MYLQNTHNSEIITESITSPTRKKVVRVHLICGMWEDCVVIKFREAPRW